MFVQGQAGQCSFVDGLAALIIQILFGQAAVFPDAEAAQRTLAVPEIQVALTQTTQSHGLALEGVAGLYAGMLGVHFRQGIARGHDEQHGLPGGAGAHGAGEIVPLEIGLCGLVGTAQSHGVIGCSHARASLANWSCWYCAYSRASSSRCAGRRPGCVSRVRYWPWSA